MCILHIHYDFGIIVFSRSLRAPTAIRLEGEQASCNGGQDEQRGADVDRHARCRVPLGRHHRRDDTHDTIESHGNTIAGRTMSARQDLGCVGIQGAVVNVEAEVDQAGEDNVLVVLGHGGVAEEEGAGDEGADDHGVLAAQQLGVAHETGEHGAEDTASVGERVVAPRLELGTVELRATGSKILAVQTLVADAFPQTGC